MKKALLIPGWEESITQVAWELIVNKLRASGYQVLDGRPDWDNGTHSDWLKEIEAKYSHNKFDLVIGHSFGAMLAFKLASKVKIQKLILCSLSPWFAEDVPDMREEWKAMVGLEIIKDVSSNFIFKDLYRLVEDNVDLVVNIKGADESDEIRRRFDEVNAKLCPTVINIPNIGHALEERLYVNAVLELLDTIM